MPFRSSSPTWNVDHEKREVRFAGAGPLDSGRFSNMTPFTTRHGVMCVEQFYVYYQLRHYADDGTVKYASVEFFEEFVKVCRTGPKAKEFWNYMNVADDSKTLLHTHGRYSMGAPSEIKEFALKWREKGIKPMPQLLKPNNRKRTTFTEVQQHAAKIQAMQKAQMRRLRIDEKFGQKLLKYKDYALIEDTSNPVWGRGKDGNGKNIQGNLLTKLAKQLADGAVVGTAVSRVRVEDSDSESDSGSKAEKRSRV